MYIQFDRIHERDRRTDGQTDTARRQRTRLCIASRDKKRTPNYIRKNDDKQTNGQTNRQTNRWTLRRCVKPPYWYIAERCAECIVYHATKRECKVNIARYHRGIIGGSVATEQEL